MHGSYVVTDKGVPGWLEVISYCNLSPRELFLFYRVMWDIYEWLLNYSFFEQKNHSVLELCNSWPMKGSIFINGKMNTSFRGTLIRHHTIILNNTTKSSSHPHAPKRGSPWTPALPFSILSISHLLQTFSAPCGLVSGVKASPNDNKIDIRIIARCRRYVMTSPRAVMPV